MSLNQRFYDACENNNLIVFNNLLYHGANVNFVRNGYTPLTISICNNHVNIYTELLNHHDIEINKKGIGGCTALHIACGTNNVQAIEAICADPLVSFNEKTHNGDTPLMLAVIDGHIEAVTKLVTYDQVDIEDLDYNERLTFSNGNIVHNFLTILGIIEEAKQRRLRSSLNMLTLEVAEESVNGNINLEDDTDEDDDDVVVDADGESVKESIKSILHLVERVRADILTKMLDYDEKKAILDEIAQKQAKEIEKLDKKHLKERQELDLKHKKQVEDQRKLHSEERTKAEQDKVATKQELEDLKKSLDYLLLTPGSPKNDKQPPCPNCPVCFESLKPPIRILQCINGHLVCEKCRLQPQVEVCPTCRESFLGRATAMEQHLRALFQVE